MTNSADKIRTRFAPSPTGFVHIGSLRTALFSHLFAKHNKGSSILRLEDTDQSRKVEGAIEYLLKVMKKVGIEFDEGYYLNEQGEIKERGKHGPYLQSERLPIYKKHVEELIQKKKAYYCFCSPERLEEVKKEQVALKKPPMYDRLCRHLSVDEVEKKLAEFKTIGKNPVVRFAIPEEGQTVIHDLVFGDITYEHKILDDQVILKSDGFPTYHLAVVVDDHYMEITHVVRGQEWIPSTPKHLLIYEAFGWQPTQFAHLPLIINADKSKLSKRQGDVGVEDFLTKGYLPEALVNFVALLGWNPKTEQEIFNFQELVEQFAFEKVHSSNAVLDLAKLDWINSHYIRQITDEDLAQMLIPYWKLEKIDTDKFKPDYLTSIAALEKERLKKLSEIGERTKYFFNRPDYDANLLTWKKSTPEDAKQKLTELHDLFVKLDETKFAKSDIETELKDFIYAKTYDNGSVLWPLRIALTGLEKSPGPFEVTATLFTGYGKTEILERIKAAIAKII